MAQNMLPSTIEAIKRIQKALGLEGHNLQKIVLSMVVNEVMTIYVKGLVTRDQLKGVADALEVIQCKDVRVDDQGQVHADEPMIVKPIRFREFT